MPGSKKILLSPYMDDFLKQNPKLAPLYLKAMYRYLEDSAPHSGAHEEKLHLPFKGSALTRRANRKARLLCSRHPTDKNTLMCIRPLPNHNHKELEQKPPSWLEDQIDKIIEAGIVLEVSEGEEELEAKTEPATSITVAVAPNMEFYHRKGILLSDDQEGIKKKTLPLVISGAAGSGKSTMLSLYLKQNVLRNPQGRYLVITNSEYLLTVLKEEWEAICALEGIEFSQVDFKTPAQLHQQSSAHPLKVYGQKEFDAWFNQHLEDLGQSKTLPLNFKNLVERKRFLYSELRAMSAAASLEEYNKENPDSLFSCKMLRALIWMMLEPYKLFLKEQEAIDYSFEAIPNLDEYDICCVDEARSLSRKQVASFGPNTLFCAGDHQQMLGREAFIPFINSSYWKRFPELKVELVTLPHSYRCSKAIVDFANFILDMNYFATGGIKNRNKHELDYIQPCPEMGQGSVQYLDDEQLTVLIENNRENIDFAVVASPEFFEKAQSKFGAERVFLPIEVQGLQYKLFLMYHVLTPESHKELNSLMNSFSKGTISPKSDICYSMSFDELFVSITRGIEVLYLYQPKQQDLHHFHRHIQHFVTQSKAQTHDFKKTVSSTAQIQAQVNTLLAHGNFTQAEAMKKVLKARTPLKPELREESEACVMHLPYLEQKNEQDTSPEDDKDYPEQPKKFKSKPKTAEALKEEGLLIRALKNDVPAIIELLFHPQAERIMKRMITLKEGGKMEVITYLDRKHYLSPVFKALEKQVSSLTFDKMYSLAKIPDLIYSDDHTAYSSLKKACMRRITPLLKRGDLSLLEIYCKLQGPIKAFLHAIDNGYIEVVTQLLKNNIGPNLPVTGELGIYDTSVFHAVLANQLEILKILLANGANHSINGVTALEVAVITNNKSIVSFLLDENMPQLPCTRTGAEWLSVLIFCKSRSMRAMLRFQEAKTAITLTLPELASLLDFQNLRKLFEKHQKEQTIQKAPLMADIFSLPVSSVPETKGNEQDQEQDQDQEASAYGMG